MAMPVVLSGSSEGERVAEGRLLLWAALVLALGLRLANASLASLHLDDFHSLHHARAGGVGELLLSLRADNHPPLSFLCLQVARSALGEAELVLRLPAIACGAAAVLLAWRLAARLAGVRAAAWAAALTAVSTLHLELSSDARMYALLALAVAGLVDAASALLDRPRPRDSLLLALWLVVGAHAHYHFLHAALIVLPTAFAIAWVRRSRADARRLLLPVLAAVLLSSPWYVWGFAAQLGHDLAPGGSSVSVVKLGEAWVHLFFHDVSLAGPRLRWAFVVCGLVVTLAGARGFLGAMGTATHGPATRPGATPWLLAAAAFALPAWSGLAAWLVPRTGFEWRYLAGAIVPMAALAGAGLAGSRVGRTLAGVIVLAGLTLSGFAIADPGQEDYEGGVTALVRAAGPADAVVAADWQPRIFPHSVGWSYYAPRLGEEGRLPRLVDHTDDFALVSEEELARHERVFVLLRSVPDGVPLLRSLRARYPTETARSFGRSIWVLEFTR